MREPARKLKRHRLRQAPLPPEEGGIELLNPEPGHPAIRRYVPRIIADEADALIKAGVLDWRNLRSPGVLPETEWTNRIVCGDAAEALSVFPDECIHLVVTSPPYWNFVDYGFADQVGQVSYEEYLEQLLSVWRQCERILVPNGKLCINVPILPIPKRVLNEGHTRRIKNLCADIECSILGTLSLERYSLYAWQKQTTEKMFGSYPYPPNLYEQNTLEFITVFVKDGSPRKLSPEIKAASRLTSSEWMDLTRQVWDLYPEDVKRVSHPAPFPESLPNRFISLYTFRNVRSMGFPGDIVLDPFCGTGTACVAARRLGRRYVGIDLGVDFCLRAAERVRTVQEDGTVFLHKK